MFIIRLKNLRVSTILGDLPWEKEAKRLVVLNIALHVADTKAGDTDELKDAVDYAMIEQRVVERLEAANYNLIEKLAADIAHFILSLDKRIVKIELEADKPGALLQSESVSVSLTLPE